MSIDRTANFIGTICRRFWSRLAHVLAAATLVGCGSSQHAIEQKAVYPVTGTILFDGAPASGASVAFHPAGGTGPGRAFPSRGRVDDEGKFQLTTYVTGDGAPAGEYVVTVYWAAPQPAAATHEDDDDSDELPPDRLGGRFRSPGKTILRAHVEPQPTTFAPLDLSGAEIGQGGKVQLRVE